MFKRLLAGLAAVICAGTIALGSNLTLMSGPQDPSQLLATINTLIRAINTGVSGRLSVATTAVGTDTTVETTLLSYTLPANQLTAAGDSLRVVCWGTSAANANTKSALLYFGSSVVNTAATMTPAGFMNGRKWMLEMTVLRSGAATQSVLGRATVDLTGSHVYTASGIDSLTATAGVAVRCRGLTGSAVQDLTAQGMLVEQIK